MCFGPHYVACTRTHTHTLKSLIYLLETHPNPEQNPKHLPLSLSKPPGEKYSVRVVPRPNFLSAYENTDSSFMLIHLKPDQSIGTKSPKWLTLKVWDALVLGLKDWWLCMGSREMEGRQTGRRKSIYLFISLWQDRLSDERFTFWW